MQLFVGVVAASLVAALAANALRASCAGDADAERDAPHPLATGTGTGDIGQDMRVETFVRTLSKPFAQQLADDLAAYAATAVTTVPPGRFVLGDETAPVRITAWTDVDGARSSDLRYALHDLRTGVLASELAVELRHYPRDSACNPHIEERQDGSARCLAARLLVCLEGDRAGHADASARLERPRRLHAPIVPGMNQAMVTAPPPLSPARVRDVGLALLGREKLDACMDDTDVARRIKDDVDAAHAAGISKPPFVVVNGRVAPQHANLLHVLALTHGATAHPAFRFLPRPQVSLRADDVSPADAVRSDE